MKFKKYYPGFKLKAVTFSFDDGTVQDIELINIFNRFNMKATFNINSKKMGHIGNFTMDNWLLNYKIKEEDINIIYKGHEIAAHSSTHTDFKDCSDDALKFEIDEDIKHLSRVVKYDVVGFAYPYGIYNDKIVERLKSNGIIYARATKCNFKFDIPSDWYRFGGTCTISDKEFESLVKKWNKNTYQTMKLFYIWGHAYELDMYHEHEKIYCLLEELSNKDDVYYATNKDIFLYLKALNDLKYCKEKNCFINNSDVDLYIEYNNEKIVVEKNKEYYL